MSEIDYVNPTIELAIRLGEVAVKNTASIIQDKIRKAKAGKQDKETIGQLEEIIDNLLEDKNNLLRIAREYEDLIQMQKISDKDIDYITNNWLPIVEKLAEYSTKNDSEQQEKLNDLIEILKPILSVETFTIFQLLGFNFREALGIPLTNLLKNTLTPNNNQQKELNDQIAQQNQMLHTIIQLLQDEEKYQKYKELMQDNG